jgi:uncharacterized protein YbjT (DUF2867 family)
VVLVTGATGNIGQRVVAGLVEAGERVRAMTREVSRAGWLPAGVELVRGDFEDRGSLREAVRGVDRVFLLSAPWPSLPSHDLALIEAAEEASVRHIVKLSAMGTERTPRLALVAVAALHEPRHERWAYTLTGPELLTERDQLSVLARLLGRQPVIAECSPQDMHQNMLASGLPPEIAAAFTEGLTLLRGGGAEVLTEDVREVLGRPPRSFEAWAREIAGA